VPAQVVRYLSQEARKTNLHQDSLFLVISCLQRDGPHGLQQPPPNLSVTLWPREADLKIELMQHISHRFLSYTSQSFPAQPTLSSMPSGLPSLQVSSTTPRWAKPRDSPCFDQSGATCVHHCSPGNCYLWQDRKGRITTSFAMEAFFRLSFLYLAIFFLFFLLFSGNYNLYSC